MLFTCVWQEAAFAAVNQAKGKADQAKAALGAAGNRVAQLEGRLAAVKEQVGQGWAETRQAWEIESVTYPTKRLAAGIQGAGGAGMARE